MEVKPLQTEKQDSQNELKDDVMVLEVKPLQAKKQYSPNDVTEEGMVIEVKPLQSLYLLLVDYQYYTL